MFGVENEVVLEIPLDNDYRGDFRWSNTRAASYMTRVALLLFSPIFSVSFLLPFLEKIPERKYCDYKSDHGDGVIKGSRRYRPEN
ncbi:hypothetical protein YC2023_116918 [Brassica napus]